MVLFCFLIGELLGIGSAWNIFKELQWIYSAGHQQEFSFPWLGLLFSVFTSALIIASFAIMKYKNWARLLLVNLMAIIIFCQLIGHIIIKANLPFGGLVRSIYPFMSFVFITDRFLYLYVPKSFFGFFTWVQLFLSFGLPAIVIFSLTRSKTREKFKE